MKQFITLCTILVVLLIQSTSYGEMRNFRGTNGKVIEAEYISFEKDTDTVKIRLKDGKEMKVKIIRFSDEDQDWIKNGGKDNDPPVVVKETVAPPANAKEVVQKDEKESSDDFPIDMSRSVDLKFVLDEAKKAIERFEKTHPTPLALGNLPCAYADYAVIQYDAGETDETRKSFEKSLKLNEAITDDKDRFDNKIQIAYRAIKTGCNDIVKIIVDDTDYNAKMFYGTRNMLAACYAALGDDATALLTAEKNENRGRALQCLGAAYLKMGNVKKAKELLENAEPAGNVFICSWIARTWLKANMFDEAQSAISRIGNDDVDIKTGSLTWLALQYVSVGDLAQAKKIAAEVKETKVYPSYNRDIALLFFAMNDMTTARDLWNDARYPFPFAEIYKQEILLDDTVSPKQVINRYEKRLENIGGVAKINGYIQVAEISFLFGDTLCATDAIKKVKELVQSIAENERQYFTKQIERIKEKCTYSEFPFWSEFDEILPVLLRSGQSERLKPILNKIKSPHDRLAALRVIAETLHANQKAAQVKEQTPDSSTALKSADAQAQIDKFCDENGSDVKAVDKGNTLLHKAARSEGIAVVKFLVDKGADVRAKNGFNGTPLHRAAQNQHVDALEIVKLLVSKGADIHAKNNDDYTPFYYAAGNPNVEITKFLVEKGAEINANGECGTTPLHEAARNSNVEVLKYLIEKGANVHAKDNRGATLLHASARNSNIEVVKYLIDKGIDINTIDNNGRTPLHEAARNQKVEVAKYLVEKGADIHAKDNRGGTPLCSAVMVIYMTRISSQKGKMEQIVETFNINNVEVAKYLIEKGADINTKDNNGWTPLHLATTNPNVEVVKYVEYLVEKGADIHAKTNDGKTALDLAKEANNADAVMFLEEKGAKAGEKAAASTGAPKPMDHQTQIDKFCAANGTDVKATDKDGNTLLFKAAQSEGPAVIGFLLAKGADIQAKDKEGCSPLHRAAERNGNIEAVKFLVEKGADVHAKSERGCEPLHYAAESNGNVEVLKFLLSKGSDINAKNKNDMTPLKCSLKNRNVEVIKTLVAQGADINAKDAQGMTPLHCAVCWGSKIDVVKTLAELGADLHVKAGCGSNALELAKGANNADAVKFLEEKGVKTGEKTNNVPEEAVQVPVAVAPAPTPVCEAVKFDGFLPAGSLEKQIDNNGELLEDGKDCIANQQQIAYRVRKPVYEQRARTISYQECNVVDGINVYSTKTKEVHYTAMQLVWEQRIKECSNISELTLQNAEPVLKKVASYVEQCPDEIPMVKNSSVTKILEWNIDNCQTPEKNYDAICSMKCDSALSALEYVRLLLERSALLKKHGCSKDAEKCAALAMYCLQGIMEYEISRLNAPAGGSCDTACNNNSCEPNSNSCGQNAQRNQMLSWLKSEMECKTNIASALHLYGIAATLSNADETLKMKVDEYSSHLKGTEDHKK